MASRPWKSALSLAPLRRARQAVRSRGVRLPSSSAAVGESHRPVEIVAMATISAKHLDETVLPPPQQQQRPAVARCRPQTARCGVLNADFA